MLYAFKKQQDLKLLLFPSPPDGLSEQGRQKGVPN